MATRFFRKCWSQKTYEAVEFDGHNYWQATGIHWTPAHGLRTGIVDIPNDKAHDLVKRWNTQSRGDWVYTLDAPPEIN